MEAVCAGIHVFQDGVRVDCAPRVRQMSCGRVVRCTRRMIESDRIDDIGQREEKGNAKETGFRVARDGDTAGAGSGGAGGCSGRRRNGSFWL